MDYRVQQMEMRRPIFWPTKVGYRKSTVECEISERSGPGRKYESNYNGDTEANLEYVKFEPFAFILYSKI